MVTRAARPGHDDQVVAGEELGPGDDDQDQAEREDQPAEQAGRRRTASSADAGRDGRGEDRAHGDEGAGEHRQGEQLRRSQRRLRRADLLCRAAMAGGGSASNPAAGKAGAPPSSVVMRPSFAVPPLWPPADGPADLPPSRHVDGAAHRLALQHRRPVRGRVDRAGDGVRRRFLGSLHRCPSCSRS